MVFLPRTNLFGSTNTHLYLLPSRMLNFFSCFTPSFSYVASIQNPEHARTRATHGVAITATCVGAVAVMSALHIHTRVCACSCSVFMIKSFVVFRYKLAFCNQRQEINQKVICGLSQTPSLVGWCARVCCLPPFVT